MIKSMTGFAAVTREDDRSTIGVTVLNPAFVPTGIAHSDRARPADLTNVSGPTRSQQIAQANSEKAVSGGRISAADVAAMTFDAIVANRFYVFTHPQIMPTVVTVYVVVLIGVMKLFDVVYVMTNGNFNTNVMATEFFNQLFTNFNNGAAAAIVVMLMIAVIPVMIFQVVQFRREEAYR